MAETSSGICVLMMLFYIIIIECSAACDCHMFATVKTLIYTKQCKLLVCMHTATKRTPKKTSAFTEVLRIFFRLLFCQETRFAHERLMPRFFFGKPGRELRSIHGLLIKRTLFHKVFPLGRLAHFFQ